MLAAKQDFAIHTVNAQQVRTLLAQVNTTESEARIGAAMPPSPASAVSRSSSNTMLQTRAWNFSSLINVTYASAKDIRPNPDYDEVLVAYYYDDQKVCLRDHA